MPTARVTLHGTLSRFLPGGQRTTEVELGRPCTAGRLLEELGLPVEALDMLVVNGNRATADTLVREGDLLEAFPFIGGG